MGNQGLAPLTENLNSDKEDSSTCGRITKRIISIPGQVTNLCTYCYEVTFNKSESTTVHSKFLNEHHEKSSHYNPSLASTMDSSHMGYSSLTSKRHNIAIEIPSLSPTEERLDNSPTGRNAKGKKADLSDTELSTPISTTFLSTEESDFGQNDKPISELSLLNLKDPAQFEDDWSRSWKKESDGWIKEIMPIFEKGPEGFDVTYVDKKNPNGPKVYFKSYPLGASKISVTFVTFVANCEPEAYILYANNPDEQKSIGKNIETYKNIRRFGVTDTSVYTLYYMAYQKILTVSSRDFVYLSVYTKIDDDTWVNAVKSITHDEYPEFPDRTRGNMIMTGTLMKRIVDPETGKVQTKITMYGDVDSKTNVPDLMSKPFVTQTLKGYAEKTMQNFP